MRRLSLPAFVTIMLAHHRTKLAASNRVERHREPVSRQAARPDDVADRMQKRPRKGAGEYSTGTMQEAVGLWALFISSFLAATLLPGGSEAVLFGLLKMQSASFWPALVVATLGNTLGGLSSYAIGRLLPQRIADPRTRAGRWQRRTHAWAQRYGSPVLLGAWIPLIGDPLCVAAGWLRLNLLPVTLFMAAGKLARYLAVAWTAI